MLFLFKRMFLSIVLFISVLYPGPANRKSYTKNNENYNKSEINNYWLALQISTFLYLEYGIDHHVNVDEKSAPNQVDQYFRNQIKWGHK